MKKWYKSNLAKAILILTALIMTVVAVISVAQIVCYPVYREEILGGTHAETYEDTQVFINRLERRASSIAYSLSLADDYETEGKFDPDKIIDLEEFEKEGKVSGTNESGLAYRQGDILDWYNQSTQMNGAAWTQAYNEARDNPVIVCKKKDSTYQYYTYEEFAEEIRSGRLAFIIDDDEFDWSSAEGTQELLNRLQNNSFYSSDYSMEEDYDSDFKGVQNADGQILYIDCWSYDGEEETYPNNLYAPQGYDSLLDLVNTNPTWNGRLSEAISLLNNTINTLGENYSSYENVNDGIEEGDTNFSYIYADLDSHRVFSNKAEYTSYDDLEKNLESFQSSIGKYVIIKPKLQDFATNLNGQNAKNWRDILYGSSEEGDQVVLAIQVDTTYPIQDAFYVEKQQFDEYGSRTAGILAGSLGALLVLLICIVWLTVIAGRTTKDEELHLNGFDHWKTEIAALLVIVIWIVGLYIVGLSGAFSVGDKGVVYEYAYEMETVERVQDIMSEAIPMAVFGAFSCGMFLIGFLSLVRRIKARTLWKDSLLRAICKFAKLAFDHLHSVWKTALVFAAFVIFHWIMMAGAWSLYPTELVFFPMLAVEAAAFVFLILQAIGKEKIREGIRRIAGGELNYKIPADRLVGDQKETAEAVNRIGEGLDAAVEKSIKSERLKTDLITNVSHDIKTPLTSIINYVDLLKQENFEDPKIQRYIEVLEQKAQRLKTLTEDVVEASKVSSGNITLEFMNLNLVEMIQQTSGEFEEKFKARDLQEVLTLPDEEAMVSVDGRRTWRILENIYNNAAKYAMPGSRVYADLQVLPGAVVFSLKNVSEQPLNISADELTERFIRGDISRSTEGSGLGLSIAKTLTEMQKGTFELYLDGDLFKVTVAFPRVK